MKTRNNIKEAWKSLHIPGNPRKEQLEAINNILDGCDTMVIAPTSFGKSAIYQVPAVINAGRRRWTLVIEPTLALIADQVQGLQELGVGAEMLTSRNKNKHGVILDQLYEHKISMLYATPERLQSSEFLSAVKENPPHLVVIDEAHCVLDWGYTFRKDYLQIKGFIKNLSVRPVIAAFTATAPPEYREPICKQLGMKKVKFTTTSLERNNIILLKEDTANLDIKKRLLRVNSSIKKYGKDGRIIVYCATRKNVDIVYNFLNDKKRFHGDVVKCHAYMDTDKREKHELQFINGSKRIMVATTAFGMGINAPDIRLVLHFNLPLSIIDYYQQIGRAGRDGKKSHAVLLYNRDDIELNRYILNNDAYSAELQDWLVDNLYELISIAESNLCLMQQLLKSLGEKHPTTCRHCTNCQKARR